MLVPIHSRTPGAHNTEREMRSVFRSQSTEARLTLVLCWAFSASLVVLPWLRIGQDDGTDAAARVVTAVLITVAFVTAIRAQLAVCRGGASLARWWFAPLLLAFGLVPMLWGALSAALLFAWAVVILQYTAGRAALVIGLSTVCFAVLYPRTGLDAVAPVWGALLEVGMNAVILVAVTRLAVLLDDLQFTREVLARRRVDLERERIGRDLHDLMGRTLVAASLRNQTALRSLGDQDPELTARLERLHETISRGQVQLRALTSGPAIAHLDDELATARMLCERVNITLTVEMRERPPSQQEAVIGLVVRENITNVLKHSRASHCTITVDRDGFGTIVAVRNDGSTPTEPTGADPVDSRLARAVEAAGGRTTTEHTAGGEFESVAWLPAPEMARS